jgi:hypothetical protein
MNISNDRQDEPVAPLAWIPWVIGACLGLAFVWLTQLYFSQKSESIALQNEAAFEHIERQSVQNQLAAERILTGRRLSDLQEQVKAGGDLARLEIFKLVSLIANPPQTRAIAVWDQAGQEGLLTVDKLPALAADKDYQLWVIDPKYPDPVSGGVFTVDARTGAARFTFHPGQPIATATKFAVSCEPKGGQPKPEGPIVLLSE